MVILASAAAIAAPACAAPYAVLYAESDNVAAVDLASVDATGPFVRYVVVTLQRAPTELPDLELPDELHHGKETDCSGGRSRLVRMAIRASDGALQAPPWAKVQPEWTGIDPAEQRLICAKIPAAKRLASLNDLRATLALGPAPTPASAKPGAAESVVDR